MLLVSSRLVRLLYYPKALTKFSYIIDAPSLEWRKSWVDVRKKDLMSSLTASIPDDIVVL